MIILGLNVLHGLNDLHGDSAACLIRDGKLLSAAEEERFVRIKHAPSFPFNAIKFCLDTNNINIGNVDFITINTKFNYNFFSKLFFLIKNFFKFRIITSRVSIVVNKKNIINKLSNFFNTSIKAKTFFVAHHLSHAYSTLFFLEENNNSIIFSFDGSGDFSTIESYLVKNDCIKLVKKDIFPNSLGLFYTAFTQLIGFKNYGDEYKFMGLAAYGRPIYYEDLKRIIIKYDPLKLDMSFFNLPEIDYSNNFPQINKLYSEKLENILKKNYNFIENDYNTQFSKDLASSVQKLFEKLVINLLKNLKAKYHSEKLYLTGGCSFNSLLVGRIVESKIFKNVLLGPNPGDAGGAIGGAFYLCKKNNIKIDPKQNIVFSGPSFSNEDIREQVITKILNNIDYKINFYENFNDLSKKAAELLKHESIIFWFQDHMEWGLRALGNRSILADPSKKI